MRVCPTSTRSRASRARQSTPRSSFWFEVAIVVKSGFVTSSVSPDLDDGLNWLDQYQATVFDPEDGNCVSALMRLLRFETLSTAVRTRATTSATTARPPIIQFFAGLYAVYGP